MKVANFSRYHLNTKRFASYGKDVSILLLLSLCVMAFLYATVIAPARDVARRERICRILASRESFLESLSVSLEEKWDYWMRYYSFLRKARYGKMWRHLWPFLEEHLPETFWISAVRWNKTKSGTYTLWVIGKGLMRGDKNLLNQTLLSMKKDLTKSELGKYINTIRLEGLEVNPREGIVSYVFVFVPVDLHMG